MSVKVHSSNSRYQLVYLSVAITVFLCLAVFKEQDLYGYPPYPTRGAPDVPPELIKFIVDKALDDLTLGNTPSSALSTYGADISGVQNYLSCVVEQASWEITPGDPSLALNPDCQVSGFKGSTGVLDLGGVCDMLSGKKVLMVGPETTYHLHDTWLQLDITENENDDQTHDCPGPHFCTFHHICRPHSTNASISATTSESRKKKLPSTSLLKQTHSALLQYTHSSTLYASPDRTDVGYQYPIVDEDTGVKTSDSYWRRRARKTDVLVLNRGPDAAPAASYRTLGPPLVDSESNHVPDFNFTFASTACAALEAGLDFLTQNFSSPAGPGFELPHDYCGTSLAYSLSLAALHVTLDSFLPAVLDTLSAISSDAALKARDTKVLWQGSWYIQNSCAASGLSTGVPILQGLWDGNDLGVDPWTYYYNAQVYMHNRILPLLLPRFNVTYLPLAFPQVKAGFEESDSGHSTDFGRLTDDQDQDSGNVGSPLRGRKGRTTKARLGKDCIRRPWEGYAEDLGRVFGWELEAVLGLL